MSPVPDLRSADWAAIRLGTARGRWLVAATVLGSAVVSIDATAVNIATPAIGRQFDASLTSLQWTVNAYTLALAGFLLLGGSLGDRYGRRRVFTIGVLWFAVASVLCAISPSVGFLIGARALQGVGGALLVPGSLAIIQASFHPDDRGAAIGAWAGLGGVATAAGPLLGGLLIDAVSWRCIFLLNLPLVAAVLAIAIRHVPESRGAVRILPDPAGATLAALALAGITYALMEGPVVGWSARPVVAAASAGVGSVAAFVALERRSRHPILPLDIFRSAQFSAANGVTFVVYAALGAAFFLLPIQLEQVVGPSALRPARPSCR